MDNIIGLGNALVDTLAVMPDDTLLARLALPKGSMQLIDRERFLQLRKIAAPFTTHRSPGGSTGNMIRALAHLGDTPGFIGKVGRDEMASFYHSSLYNIGVHTQLIECDLPTGIASAFVSRDGERTFATYLGASVTLTAEELIPGMFEGYKYLFVEGYLVQNHSLIECAMRTAKQTGLKVCIDLASYNIVEEDHAFFRHLVEQYVDIVFANESEAKAFTGKEPQEALEEIGKLCEIAIVKTGRSGSLIRHNNTNTVITPEFVPSHEVTDTTGAGDYYAAGFLYGLTHGYDLSVCGRIGSILSAEVIRHVGTSLDNQQWERIKSIIKTVLPS